MSPRSPPRRRAPSGSQETRRWWEPDSNHRSRSEKSGRSETRASASCILLGAASAVFQPRGGPSNLKSWHHKKSGAEHSIQRHSSSPTGLSGGCAKPIFDHAHERSAKRQGERGLILCPLSSNLPYRARRVELRLQQRRKTEEAGFELSVPRGTTKVSRQKLNLGVKAVRDESHRWPSACDLKEHRQNKDEGRQRMLPGLSR